MCIRDRIESEQRERQLRSARAEQAGNAQYIAAAHLKRDVLVIALLGPVSYTHLAGDGHPRAARPHRPSGQVPARAEHLRLFAGDRHRHDPVSYTHLERYYNK